MSTSIPSVRAQAKQKLINPNEHLVTNPAGMTPALTCCCDAWAETLRENRAAGVNPVSCYINANSAYRAAMPPLTTARNIQDFIACAAFGVMNGPIALPLVPKLLYAAQVATSNLRNSRPKSTSPKSKSKTKNPHPERLRQTKTTLKNASPTPPSPERAV